MGCTDERASVQGHFTGCCTNLLHDLRQMGLCSFKGLVLIFASPARVGFS